MNNQYQYLRNLNDIKSNLLSQKTGKEYCYRIILIE